MEIAVAHGFQPGARLPDTVYCTPLYFADQDWKRPDRARYMAALAQHRPTMATVLDWERPEQLAEVLDWAEEAAQHVARVLIIPKVVDGIDRLPRRVGGADVVLAYSVATKYGGTSVCAWEFAGWPVHLLGGAPHKQMATWRHLAPVADVVSADGNYALRMAVQRCAYWAPGNARGVEDRYWPTLREVATQAWGHDAPYEAFTRSCAAIRAAWGAL
jgi:hypothetical protein